MIEIMMRGVVANVVACALKESVRIYETDDEGQTRWKMALGKNGGRHLKICPKTGQEFWVMAPYDEWGYVVLGNGNGKYGDIDHADDIYALADKLFKHSRLAGQFGEGKLQLEAMEWERICRHLPDGHKYRDEVVGAIDAAIQ